MDVGVEGEGLWQIIDFDLGAGRKIPDDTDRLIKRVGISPVRIVLWPNQGRACGGDREHIANFQPRDVGNGDDALVRRAVLGA